VPGDELEQGTIEIGGGTARESDIRFDLEENEMDFEVANVDGLSSKDNAPSHGDRSQIMNRISVNRNLVKNEQKRRSTTIN